MYQHGAIFSLNHWMFIYMVWTWETDILIQLLKCIWFYNVYILIVQSFIHTKIYTEWPHRQCIGLAPRRSHVRGWLSAASLVICSPASIAVWNTWSSGGTALCRVGCDQSIGSTVSDAIVRSLLWLTATRGSPLGYFSKITASSW